jgi:hypothetical protein
VERIRLIGPDLVVAGSRSGLEPAFDRTVGMFGFQRRGVDPTDGARRAGDGLIGLRVEQAGLGPRLVALQKLIDDHAEARRRAASRQCRAWR